MRRNRFIIKTEYFGNVSFMLFLYWAVLVLWQNMGGSEARSTDDMVIKIGLLLYFALFYLFRAKTLYYKAGWVMLLALCLVVSFAGEADRSLSVMIAYVYPILVLMMVYGLGDKLEINKKQLIAFCNCIIVVVLYAAIYAVLFCWEQFESAFSITNAYGNELSSFFVSSHEYGMYLVFGMASCAICLHFNAENKRLRKIYYFLVLLLFFVNVILTYSRTSILAAILLFFVCTAFLKRKTRLRFFGIAIVIVIVVLCVPTLRDFFYNIVMKENHVAGRDKLGALALQYFNEGTVLEKLFGHGISASRVFFEEATNHGSVHNAYLQVLVYYGLAGVVFMLSFLGVQAYVCVKEIKRDRFLGALSLGFLIAAAAMMFTNTAMIFNSPIDSYFLTMMAILLPKYVRNAVCAGRFYGEGS